MEKTTAKKGILNIFWGIFGQLVILGLGIVITRLILLNYGSEMNGFLNSITQIFTYISLVEAGVGGSALQALYSPVAKKDTVKINAILIATRNFYKKAGFVYLLIFLAVAFLYPFFVKTAIDAKTLTLVIIYTGIGYCVSFFYQSAYKIFLRAEGKVYVVSNITTAIGVVNSIVKIILILAGMNIVTVQFFYGLISMLEVLLYVIYLKKKYNWLDRTVTPDLQSIEQKNAVLVQQITNMIFTDTDVLLLTFMGQNLRVVSVYTMYNIVIYMIKSIINQILGAFSFKLGQTYQLNKTLYLKYHHIFEVFNLIIVFSCMNVTYYLLMPFMRLYTAGVDDISYIDYKLLLLFIVIQLLDIGRTSSANAINYAGHFKKTQYRCIAEAVINIICSIAGIYYLGIYGVLAGTIIALLYRTNDMILYSYKHLLKQKPWQTYRRWLVCLLVFALSVKLYWIHPVTADNYFLVIGKGAVVGILSLLCYTVVLAVTERKIYQSAWELLKKRI